MKRRAAAVVVVLVIAAALVLYALLRLQHLLPFNPQGLPPVAPDLAFDTAASFTTNTNWQSYVGETTMSYLSQMAGLAYHNFVSAAAGIAIRRASPARAMSCSNSSPTKRRSPATSRRNTSKP